MNKQVIIIGLISLVGIVLGIFGAYQFSKKQHLSFDNQLDISQLAATPKPLQKYSIDALSKDFAFTTSNIVVEEPSREENDYTSYLFSYTTSNGKVSGQLNVPKKINFENSSEAKNQQQPVIILIRGYVPQEIYQTGIGTENAAGVFAEHGYITLAPDFLGYGQSDPEPADSWEARFIKPIHVIELIRSVEEMGFEKIGIWAHSNGGQIGLTALEIMGKPYPMTLWAPVTAPFPYSVLFFSDENEDEGKTARKWVAQFEQIYDVFDFSLTQHLNRLVGPIQLHHGTADKAALKEWSDEFIVKLETENDRRAELEATSSGLVEEESLEPLDYTYFEYVGADHNMKPVWDTVIQRDLNFFEENL